MKKESDFLNEMILLYCKRLQEKAFSYLEESIDSEIILNYFIQIIRQKNVTILDLSLLDDNDLVDIYEQIKEKNENSPQDALKCIRIISKFLQFLEKVQNAVNNENTIQETIAEYGPHCA